MRHNTALFFNTCAHNINMASRTSLLLIAKQGKGVEYHALLNKILGDYSNINSARAALSRTLKDLDALGMIRRRGDLIQLTNKGIIRVNMEMKNKLLLKLNTLTREKRAVEDPDEFVKLLSTLIERGKQDRDLLKIARESSSFFISDISALREKIGERAKHYSYLDEVLKKHVASLKEMDFRDSRKTENMKAVKKLALKQSKETKLGEFFIDSQDQKEREKLQKKFNGELKGKSLAVKAEFLPQLFDFIEHSKKGEKLSLFLHDIEFRFDGKRVTAIGPASKLRALPNQ